MLTQLRRAAKRMQRNSYFMRNVINRIQDLRRSRYYRSVYKKIETDSKIVIFESFLGKQYACSPKAIYEAMRNDHRFDDYQFIWVFRKASEMRQELGDQRTLVVRYNTRRYFRAYARAKYWVTNWRLSSALVKKDDQICVQTWHGTPLKKIGLDLNIEGNATTSQRRGHKLYLNDARLYDRLISPSAFCTRVFSSAFGLDRLGKTDVIRELGYPRNDALSNPSEKTIAQLKDDLGLPSDKKIVLYAPTWRDNQHKLGVGYTLDIEEHVDKLFDAAGDDFVVIVRLHYLVAEKFDSSRYVGKVYNFSDLDDVNQLYLVSDVLVTDYSSVFFDYANLNRPILFYMYDLDEYQNSVRDFYIDLSELPGPIVKTQNELIECLNHIHEVRRSYADAYRRFNDLYNYLDDGCAGLRAALDMTGEA